jgi:hypothetical protein
MPVATLISKLPKAFFRFQILICSIGMQFNFVFVSHGHKNRGKPTLNLQSGEYLDFIFQTLKKTHRNLFIYLFIYNPKANEHYCIVVKMIPIYIRPPKALNGSIKEIK